MGVPAFFRWLTRKYPSVIVHCIEEKNKDFDGNLTPVNSADPNPNGVEFDNLYLDMNGIIHPCTHPEDRPAPKNEDEMMVAIFECIDRLFRIVRPRKLLYMAIDGVAPRAKMNQQRSRRFRASKETSEKVEEMSRIRQKLTESGAYLPPEKPKEEHFDSNCITPGTPFMARLSTCLHYYIHSRLNSDPGWANIKVILSDANVPGEGEHKIMDFIRKQRSQPDYDPNTHHVLCGADADLIMLGLATHELNFTIIREEFQPNKPRPCDICGQLGHEMKECTGAEPNLVQTGPQYGTEQQFIFVRLNVLREYLERELAMPNLPFPYEFDRALDDWVFMCFFVGNDFLPHLPSLEIRENAIDRLVNLYKKAVYKTNGWLTNSGEVYLHRVQLIMADLGDMEDEIFKQRQRDEISFKQRMKFRNQRAKRGREYRPQYIPSGQFAPLPLGRGRGVAPVANARIEAFHMRVQGMSSNTQVTAQLQTVSAAVGLQALIEPASSNVSQGGQKRKRQDDDDEEEEENNDEVRLWEDGFKDRYYQSKFDVDNDNLEFRGKVGHQYVRGLCWVLQYYYQGCASWNWYFPYHYAPFASDFLNVADVPDKFDKSTKPFKPLEQLMSVFPAASRSHVPEPWGRLMMDPESPIIDFYPEDFQIDLNGKKYAWQGVALLPFVDESRLHKALEPYYPLLTPAELKRNICGDDRLYISKANPGYSFLTGLIDNDIDAETEVETNSDGIRGVVLLSEESVRKGGSLESPVMGLPVIRNNQVVCVRFRNPKYDSDFVYPARRLPGAVEPPRVLKPGEENPGHRSWKPQIGMSTNRQYASLSGAGHRMVNHYQERRDPGQYSAVPPPPGSRAGRGGRGGTFPRGGRGGHQNSYNSNVRGGGQGYQHYANQGGYQSSNHDGYQSSNRSSYQSSNRDGYQSSNRGGYQRANQGNYSSSSSGNPSSYGYQSSNMSGNQTSQHSTHGGYQSSGYVSSNQSGYHFSRGASQDFRGRNSNQSSNSRGYQSSTHGGYHSSNNPYGYKSRH